MRKHLFPQSTFAGAIALLLVASTLTAADIRDEAGFFSDAAKATANGRIRALEQKHSTEIRIETYAALPANKQAAARTWTSHERDEFYRSWIMERSQSTRAKGLFVLATRQPGHLKVAAGKSLLNRGLTHADDVALSNALLAKFKVKDYDGALTDGLNQIESSFAKLSAAPVGAPRSGTTLHPRTATNPGYGNYSGSQNAPVAQKNSFGWTGLIIMLVVGVVGFMLLSTILRSLFGGGGGGGYGQPGGQPGGYGQQGYGGGGGGGFMSSLFGSVAGSMAGNWFYDSMFRNHSSGHSGMNSGMGGGDAGQSGGWDNTSSDAGGGNDFAGGDFSGGDFGGGDSGGGGGGDDAGGDF